MPPIITTMTMIRAVPMSIIYSQPLPARERSEAPAPGHPFEGLIRRHRLDARDRPAPGSPHGGAVGEEADPAHMARALRIEAWVRMGWIPARDDPGVALAGEDAGAPGRAQALRGPRVVGVVMGDDHRPDRLGARAQGLDCAGEIPPVAGVARVDEDEFLTLPDEIEVDPPGPEPVDAVGHL